MPELADKLEAARAEVARLERIAVTATCREMGCDWHHVGGRNCGCHENAHCSIAVHECSRCGDSDYGENAEAYDQITRCEHQHDGAGEEINEDEILTAALAEIATGEPAE